jgi:RimJ/RimL family protein N-acetyltransferase
MNHRPLFEGRKLQLTPIDLEKDPAVVAQWTTDLILARRLRSEQPVRPLAVFEVRKVLDNWIKERERSKNAFLYALRPLDDDSLIGMIRISSVMWVHGAADLDLMIGSADYWAAYAQDALSLGLQYAFDELNLFRIRVWVEENDVPACALYSSANFYLEVRQRQAVYHQGRYWDMLHYGLLRPEWAVYFQQLGVAV